MEGEDAEAIKKGTDDLTQSAHKLAEAMYAKKPGCGDGECGASCGSAEQAEESKPKNDNVVDADFEEVKGDKK
jgi:molecular chaperone DnaK